MPRLPLIIALSACLAAAGCTEEEFSGAPRPAAADRAFPLSGSWTWAGGSRLLPSRDIGCGPEQSKLTAHPQAVEVETAGFRHTAFSILEWWQRGDDELTLRVEDHGALGRRRLLVRLDLSDAGFVRFAGATDQQGRPLTRRRDVAGRDIEPAEQLASLASAFTLLRCGDGTFDTAALLRGPAEDVRVRVLR